MSYREDHVFRAKLAQQTNRFDLMVESMKMVVMIDAKLTEEERELLSNAYKNAIEKKRLDLRTIENFERKVEYKAYENSIETTNDFRFEVEKEIREICYEILELLDQYLIPASLTVFAKAFYFKMKGDYYKCLSEFTSGKDRNEWIEKSRVSYIASSNNLWSQLRGDIDVLAELYDWGEDSVEKTSTMKDLSIIVRSVESYFKLWTKDNELKTQFIDPRKKWKSADFVLSI